MNTKLGSNFTVEVQDPCFWQLCDATEPRESRKDGPSKCPSETLVIAAQESQGEQKTDIGHVFCCSSLSYNCRLLPFCCLHGVVACEGKFILCLLGTWRWTPKLAKSHVCITMCIIWKFLLNTVHSVTECSGIRL